MTVLIQFSISAQFLCCLISGSFSLLVDATCEKIWLLAAGCAATGCNQRDFSRWMQRWCEIFCWSLQTATKFCFVQINAKKVCCTQTTAKIFACSKWLRKPRCSMHVDAKVFCNMQTTACLFCIKHRHAKNIFAIKLISFIGTMHGARSMWFL